MRPHRRQPTRLPCPWDSPGKNTGVGCHFLLQCMKVKSEGEVAQSCPTPSDPMDCSPPGSSVHGVFQAWVLEWGAITFLYYILVVLLLWLYFWSFSLIWQILNILHDTLHLFDFNLLLCIMIYDKFNGKIRKFVKSTFTSDESKISKGSMLDVCIIWIRLTVCDFGCLFFFLFF